MNRKIRLISVDESAIIIWWLRTSFTSQSWQLTWGERWGWQKSSFSKKYYWMSIFGVTWSKYGLDHWPQYYDKQRLLIIRFLWFKLWLDLGRISREYFSVPRDLRTEFCLENHRYARIL